MLEACKEYLNTLAEGETEWRETLQGAPKDLRVGWPFSPYSLILNP